MAKAVSRQKPFFAYFLILLTIFGTPGLALGADRAPSYSSFSEPAPEDLFGPLPQELPNAPEMGEQERLRSLKFHEVLADPLQRVSVEFKIPESLLPRVQFWFDVYTRFGRKVHAIHHDRYPWIVYEILDLSEAVENAKGPEWLRLEKAEKYVKIRRSEIRQALVRLAHRPNNPRTDLERHLLEVLREVPGPRKRVLREASLSVRSQLGQRDFFIQGLRRSSKYLPYMEEILYRADLPLDLARMPFVESSFNEMAKSKVGASGIWQIMPLTGAAYGLVSESIDERDSPLKATAMAARLLHSYNHALKSWPLAITSYNHGIGNIQRAIRAAKSHDLAQIIARYHRGDFKFASSNFYACFLAALFAERYSEVVFPSVVRDQALTSERYTLTRNTRLRELLKLTGLSIDQVLSLNLDLNARHWRQITLPKGFVLALPDGRGQALIASAKGRLRPALIPPTRISELGLKSKRGSANPG